MSTVVRVAVAVVESAGKFLVGTRPEGKPLAGMAEFPGGKCDTDETPRSCVVRECREETGLLVMPREHLVTTTHEYEHGRIELHFWRCCLVPDQVDEAKPAGSFRWVSSAELQDLDFPEGNHEVLQILARNPES